MVIPENREELADCVQSSSAVDICGRDTQRAWRVPRSAGLTTISLQKFDHVLEYSPADQVIVVEAGITIEALQEALAETGQCLPLSPLSTLGTVGGAVALGLPHALEAGYGSWRDWILGARMMRGDGEIVWAGSKVVKSVAGYDLHRLQVGARGVFGIILEVALRVSPAASCPLRDVLDPDVDAPVAMVRTWPSQFLLLCNSLEKLIIHKDEPSSTVWLKQRPPKSDLPEGALIWEQSPMAPFLNAPPAVARRMKKALDPEMKFNPGEFGEGVLGEKEGIFEAAQ